MFRFLGSKIISTETLIRACKYTGKISTNFFEDINIWPKFPPTGINKVISRITEHFSNFLKTLRKASLGKDDCSLIFGFCKNHERLFTNDLKKLFEIYLGGTTLLLLLSSSQTFPQKFT